MNNEIVSLIFQGIFLVGSMIIGFWKIMEFINKKIEHLQKNNTASMALLTDTQDKKLVRIYERMDERQEETEKIYVRIDMHNLTIQHLEQKTNEKFDRVIEKFELQLGELTRAVQKLVVSEEKRQKP